MSITEIMEQAQTLTLHERKELVKLLIDSLDVAVESPNIDETEHWGQSLNNLLNSLDLPDSDDSIDPVEWVKQQRQTERKNRLGDWGSNN